MSKSINYKHDSAIGPYRNGKYQNKHKGFKFSKEVRWKCRCDYCMPDNIPKRAQGRASDRRRMLNNVSDY